MGDLGWVDLGRIEAGHWRGVAFVLVASEMPLRLLKPIPAVKPSHTAGACPARTCKPHRAQREAGRAGQPRVQRPPPACATNPSYPTRPSSHLQTSQSAARSWRKMVMWTAPWRRWPRRSGSTSEAPARRCCCGCLVPCCFQAALGDTPAVARPQCMPRAMTLPRGKPRASNKWCQRPPFMWPSCGVQGCGRAGDALLAARPPAGGLRGEAGWLDKAS